MTDAALQADNTCDHGRTYDEDCEECTAEHEAYQRIWREAQRRGSKRYLREAVQELSSRDRESGSESL